MSSDTDLFIRNFILPVVETRFQGDTPGPGLKLEAFQLRGTAFVIGKRNFALTAAHVLHGLAPDDGHVLLVDADGYTPVKIVDSERHPTEDLALLKLSGGAGRSIFRLSDKTAEVGFTFQMWGYPDDAGSELEQALASGDRTHGGAPRPELMYLTGYVRRWIGSGQPGGAASRYDLSLEAGDAFAGAPVINAAEGVWHVMGVYLGDKTTSPSGGLAMRMRDLGAWAPNLLGTTLFKEAGFFSP